MDEKDQFLVKLLQEDGRMKIQELARKMELSHAAVHARLIKLKKAGYIKGYTIVLDPDKFGKKFLYLIYIKVDQLQADQAQAHKNLSKIEGVEEVFTIAGDWDFLVKIRTEGLDRLTGFLMEKIQQAVPGFQRNKTVTVINETKSVLIK